MTCPILGPTVGARRFGIVSGVWLTPRGYVTIKSKCFTVGDKVGRACDKARHSCARKTCSYSKWPKKIPWIRMNRAIDLVIRKVLPGAEVWGLDDAARRLHKGLARLKPSSPHNFCGMGVLVGDGSFCSGHLLTSRMACV